MATSKESHNRAVVLGVLLANYVPPDKPRLSPYTIAALVAMMQRAARGATARATAACNRPMSAKESERADRWLAAQEGKINGLLAITYEKGCAVPPPTLVVNRDDPRAPGASLKIPGVRGDGMVPENGHAIF